MSVMIINQTLRCTFFSSQLVFLFVDRTSGDSERVTNMKDIHNCLIVEDEDAQLSKCLVDLNVSQDFLNHISLPSQICTVHLLSLFLSMQELDWIMKGTV